MDKLIEVSWVAVEKQIDELAEGKDPMWKYGQRFAVDSHGDVTVKMGSRNDG